LGPVSNSFSGSRTWWLRVGAQTNDGPKPREPTTPQIAFTWHRRVRQGRHGLLQRQLGLLRFRARLQRAADPGHDGGRRLASNIADQDQPLTRRGDAGAAGRGPRRSHRRHRSGGRCRPRWLDPGSLQEGRDGGVLLLHDLLPRRVRAAKGRAQNVGRRDVAAQGTGAQTRGQWLDWA